MAKANPFRFSTKYQDDETDLLYYGYRYYSASTGRWISRDPIEEQGSLDVYGFVDNRPVSDLDLLGLDGTNDLGKQKCSSCRCKKVKGGPAGKDVGSKYGDSKSKDPGLQLGIKVPWKVEVEEGSDISKCKCKFIDKGKIAYTVTFHGPGAPPDPIHADPAPIDKTHDVPCTVTMDRPGPHFAGVPSGSDNLSVDASITYDISTTLECHDEDGGGTKSDSVSVKGTYEGKGIKW